VQTSQDVDHQPLVQHIQRRRRLVKDQHLRPQQQRDRHRRPLLHPARELALVGLPHPVDRQSHQTQQLTEMIPALGLAREHALVRVQNVLDLPAYRQHRVERVHRGLENHSHISRAQCIEFGFVHRRQASAAEPDLARDDPARRRDDIQQRVGQGRLAATRLADDRMNLTGANLQADVLDCTDITECDSQVVHIDDGFVAGHHWTRSRGLNRLSSAREKNTNAT
jgi:hypothetical protein